MSRLRVPLAILAACLALAACKTKPESLPTPEAAEPEAAPAQSAPAVPESAPKVVPEASAVSADEEGFWPSETSRKAELGLSIRVGNADLVKAWRVEIVPEKDGSKPVRSFEGGSSDVPAALIWDGVSDSGGPAPEGSYAARLTVDYGDERERASTSSASFDLCLSPPEPALLARPSRLEPTPEGVKQPVAFEIGAKAVLAPIDSWSLDIIAPDGSTFRGFAGSWPAEGSHDPIEWGGDSASGAFVEAGKRYAAVLTVEDIYGHGASAQISVAVADLPFVSEKSSVQPWTSGFSPNGDGIMDGMDFSLSFGHRESLRSWAFDIVHAEKGVVRSFESEPGSQLPESLSWDGLDEAGTAAPEGRYVAVLRLDYGKAYSAATARSPVFTLSVTPPELKVSTTPELFSPGSDGPDSTLAFKLEAASPLARMADWRIEVIDPGDSVFARFNGTWPAGAVEWDGRGEDGSLVESAETYGVVARVRDEFGNVAQAEGKIDVDILVVKDGDRYRVAVTGIVFKGYTDDFEDLPAERVSQNMSTLDRLAEKFSKFPDYKIHLIGHAVMINWDDPNLGIPEQRAILLPLSKARADAIAKALAARGIDPKRMSTEGVGATRQLVPDSDLVNRWKNRRVEFYLEK
jgi:hypothetical protein